MPFFPLYVDPTAAGLGLQMLLGGIVGGLVTIRLFWARIFGLIRRGGQDTGANLTAEGSPETPIEEEISPDR